MLWVPQISEVHADDHPHDAKEILTHQATFFHCFVVQLWCSLALSVISVVDGHPKWCAIMQPYAQQNAVCCVLWHLSIRNNINFFSNFSYSNLCVREDHKGQSRLPKCALETWPSMTLSPVHQCSFLGILFIDTDHCRPTRPAILEMLWPSNLVITPWSLNSLKSLYLPIFPFRHSVA